MTFVDIIVFIIYLIIFFFIFRKTWNRYEDPVLRKNYRISFWVKVIACIAFIYYQMYVSIGDSVNLYQKESNNIYNLILEDPRRIEWLFQKGQYFNEAFLKDSFNVGYFSSEANFMIIRFVTLLSFVTAGSYPAICLIFAMVALTGIWKLYLFFYAQYPHLHKKLALAILFIPSLVFWSSGMLKDPVCISSLGWFTYASYELLFKKKSFLKNHLS